MRSLQQDGARSSFVHDNKADECPQFPASKLAAHSEDCFARQAQAQSKSRSPPPLAPPPAASKFRFAGTGAKAAVPPPPPPPIARAPIPLSKAKDKGKAKEILIIDDDDEEEVPTGVGEKVVPNRKRPVEEEEDYFQDDFPEWEEFDEPAPRPPPVAVPIKKRVVDKGKGRAVAASTKSKTIVIDLDDDDFEIDDHDDAPLANSSSVNSRRLPGPPVDSSPPKASIYLSTLPQAVDDHLYTTKAPKGRADDDDLPQKMSAPVKRSYSRGGFKGRRGRGGARRGGRK